jgi:hypothetical protein
MDLQAQCELGQEQLMQMQYLLAERTLAAAEEIAWAQRDFDTLARLYMPLQEARRQRRQRCGEGTVCLDLWARDPGDILNAAQIAARYRQGQLVVAGWAMLDSALAIRRIAAEQNLYLDTFLAAIYAVGDARVVVIVPTANVALPPADQSSLDALIRRLPAHSVVLAESDLPRGARKASAETYALVMALWEKLHAPFLAAADAATDPIRKIEGYRQTIAVDYACELAHQKLSDVAHSLSRK